MNEENFNILFKKAKDFLYNKINNNDIENKKIDKLLEREEQLNDENNDLYDLIDFNDENKNAIINYYLEHNNTSPGNKLDYLKNISENLNKLSDLKNINDNLTKLINKKFCNCNENINKILELINNNILKLTDKNEFINIFKNIQQSLFNISINSNIIKDISKNINNIDIN
jgi:hypothetical protein